MYSRCVSQQACRFYETAYILPPSVVRSPSVPLVSTCRPASWSKSVINASIARIICHHECNVTVYISQIVSPLRQKDHIEELSKTVRETGRDTNSTVQYNTYSTHKKHTCTCTRYVSSSSTAVSNWMYKKSFQQQKLLLTFIYFTTPSCWKLFFCRDGAKMHKTIY